jgi:hypothetical protein
MVPALFSASTVADESNPAIFGKRWTTKTSNGISATCSITVEIEVDSMGFAKSVWLTSHGDTKLIPSITLANV